MDLSFSFCPSDIILNLSLESPERLELLCHMIWNIPSMHTVTKRFIILLILQFVHFWCFFRVWIPGMQYSGCICVAEHWSILWGKHCHLRVSKQSNCRYLQRSTCYKLALGSCLYTARPESQCHIECTASENCQPGQEYTDCVCVKFCDAGHVDTCDGSAQVANFQLQNRGK